MTWADDKLKRAILATFKARGLRPALVTEGVLQRIQGKGTFLADSSATIPQLSSAGR
jgi:hypothetical protein